MAQINENLNKFNDLGQVDNNQPKSAKTKLPFESGASRAIQDFSEVLNSLRARSNDPANNVFSESAKNSDNTPQNIQNKRTASPSSNLQDNLLKSFQTSSSSGTSSKATNIDDYSKFDIKDTSSKEIDRSFGQDSAQEVDTAKPTKLSNLDNQDAGLDAKSDAQFDAQFEDGDQAAINKLLAQDQSKLSGLDESSEDLASQSAIKGAIKDGSQQVNQAQNNKPENQVSVETNGLDDKSLVGAKNLQDINLASFASGKNDQASTVNPQNQDAANKAGILETSGQKQNTNAQATIGQSQVVVNQDGVEKTIVLPNSLLQTGDKNAKTATQSFASQTQGQTLTDNKQQVIQQNNLANTKDTNPQNLAGNLDLSTLDQTKAEKPTTLQLNNLNDPKASQLEGVKTVKVTNLEQSKSSLEAQGTDKQASNLILAQNQTSSLAKNPQAQASNPLEDLNQAKSQNNPEAVDNKNKVATGQESLAEKVAAKTTGDKQPASNIALVNLKAQSNLAQNQKSVQKQQANAQVALNTELKQNAKPGNLATSSNDLGSNKDSSNQASQARLKATSLSNKASLDSDDTKTKSSNQNFAQTLVASTSAKSSLAAPQQIASLQNQIVNAAKKLNGPNAQKIELELNPSNLGKLELKLEFEKSGAMKLIIVTDKPETLEMLNRDQNQLIKSLQDSGISLQKDALSFQFTGDQQAQNQGSKDGSQDQSNPNGNKNQDNQQNQKVDTEQKKYIDDSMLDIKV